MILKTVNYFKNETYISPIIDKQTLMMTRKGSSKRCDMQTEDRPSRPCRPRMETVKEVDVTFHQISKLFKEVKCCGPCGHRPLYP